MARSSNSQLRDKEKRSNAKAGKFRAHPHTRGKSDAAAGQPTSGKKRRQA